MNIDREKSSEDRSFYEETAAELSPRLPSRLTDNNQDDIDDLAMDSAARDVQEGTGGTAVGIIGLVFSLVSLFTLPFLLSLIGIGAGFIAYRRGADSLGKWAIGIGLISLLGAMMFAPFLG